MLFLAAEERFSGSFRYRISVISTDPLKVLLHIPRDISNIPDSGRADRAQPERSQMDSYLLSV